MKPDAPTILFLPPGHIGVGQTYAVVWSDVKNLDADGVYVVERSTDSSFSSIVDWQQTSSTSASFVAPNEGVDYHRVRAISGCDTSLVSANSAAKSVTVAAATPNVVFTVQPAAAIVPVGDPAATRVSSFVVENITKSTINVAVPSAPIASPQFFTIVDPTGELAASGTITLMPRQPRRLEIHFLDVPTGAPATYEGFVFLVGQPDPLVVTPYAFVNLKVGATDTTAPVFWFRGIRSEYAFFPGYPTDQPDAARPPITIQIENPGDSPMDLGAEIGPEVWLVPKPGWNAKAIPPKQMIDVELSVDRSRALTGSALPRYTYLTVRSKNGQSARLLVQDNDAPKQSVGRPMLDPAVRSYVVPQVVSVDSPTGHTASRVRLTNVGGAAVNAELFFTPAGAAGDDVPAVRRAVVVAPPNDVVTLTDPLLEVYGLASPATGQLEVRAPPDKIAFLTVSSDISVPVASGGSFAYVMPVARRGEGARQGSSHTIAGISSTQAARPQLVLAETSGTDGVRGHVSVYDGTARHIGDVPFFVAQNGQLQIDDVVAAAGGGNSLATGRADLVVEAGTGAVIGDVVLLDPAKQGGAVIVSQPSDGAVHGSAIPRQRRSASTTISYIVAAVANGNPTGVSNVSLATVVALSAPPSGPVTFDLDYLDALGFVHTTHPVIPVPAGNTVQLDNVLESVFGMSPGRNAQGTLLIRASSAAAVVARLASGSGGSSGPAFSALPVIPSVSEVLTSASQGMTRPVYIDGLEQSVDASRGRRWDLLLSEIGGNTSSVTVRLFEAGNRTSPIAEQTVTLRGHEQKRLATIFQALALDTDERRKDRTNVEAVVVPESGDGVIVASAISTDNQTSDTTAYVLTPSGGVAASGVMKVTPVAPPPPPVRRRAVRH